MNVFRLSLTATPSGEARPPTNGKLAFLDSGRRWTNADLQRPDSSVVEQLAERVNELRELASAAEAERSAAFSSSLLELMRRHTTVLSDRPSLKPYIDRFRHNHHAIEAPKDAAEALEEFDRILRSLDEVVDRFRKKSKAVLEANAEERSKLLAEINDLHAAETDQYSRIETQFLRLFRATDPSVAAEPTQPPVTPASTAASERDADGDEPGNTAEVLTPSADADLEGDEATVPRPENRRRCDDATIGKRSTAGPEFTLKRFRRGFSHRRAFGTHPVRRRPFARDGGQRLSG